MGAQDLSLPPARLPPEAEVLRREVRAFLDEERAAGRLQRPTAIGLGFSPEFSRRLAERGWIGLTWPKEYGGGGRSFLERYVLTEELLAASAPVGAHWIADRQSGPVLLKFGAEAQKQYFLPKIVKGECYFCIGMSEPGSGSDLASLRSRAEKVEGGWRLNGQKLWTTNAHRVHYIITLMRSSTDVESRHAGLSQFIVDLKAPGVSIRPVRNMPGEHDFNEIFFDDVFVGDDALVGEAGNGWNQIGAELAYERSGPERWLSSFRILCQLAESLGPSPSPAARERLGRLMAHILTLRQLSTSIANMLETGRSPNVQAAVVKDLGTHFEQELVLEARDIALAEGLADEALHDLLVSGQVWSPAFTIRGGASEILRGIIARGLGVR